MFAVVRVSGGSFHACRSMSPMEWVGVQFSSVDTGSLGGSSVVKDSVGIAQPVKATGTALAVPPCLSAPDAAVRVGTRPSDFHLHFC